MEEWIYYVVLRSAVTGRPTAETLRQAHCQWNVKVMGHGDCRIAGTWIMYVHWRRSSFVVLLYSIGAQTYRMVADE